MSIHQAIFGMQKSSRAAKTQLIYFFARSPSISVNLHQQISMLCLLGIWQGTQSVKYMEQSIKSFPELMGARSSKSRLCKEDLEFLKEKTRYDESTITEWYKGFIQVDQRESPRQANDQDVSKGAGAFHSASQSKEGQLVLALPNIRFSWNFYQIISGTKYE